ncbi:HEAT repeat domain-containing protein [bacterium]|nr:HEAT repeat domain-containing protein [bacterium]
MKNINRTKHPEVNLNAARALAAIGDPGVPALISAIRDEDRRLRRTAVRVLGRIGNKAAVPVLSSALRDKHAAVRTSAAEALGAIGSAAAVPALQEALSDKSKHVRHKAQLALRNIGNLEKWNTQLPNYQSLTHRAVRGCRGERGKRRNEQLYQEVNL